MPLLTEQFEQAKHNVEPPPDDVKNATAAHLGVRRALETSPQLRAMDIDTVLIGSYARHVAIRRIKDVDVFSQLPNIDSRLSPTSLLQLFRDVLIGDFGKQRVELQARSVKTAFPEFDLSVDAVPARPCDSHWEVPDRAGSWEETDPPKLGSLTTAMNHAYDDHYVPTVKLIRQARRAQLGESQPGGFYLEIASYHAFSEGLKADSTPEYFCEALAGVAAQLGRARSGGLPDPTLPGRVISTRAADAELKHAEEVFRGLAVSASAALKSPDACAAALVFRNILRKTSDGEWVFPMPSYCNDDGTRRPTASGIRPGSSRVPESNRFASRLA